MIIINRWTAFDSKMNEILRVQTCTDPARNLLDSRSVCRMSSGLMTLQFTKQNKIKSVHCCFI